MLLLVSDANILIDVENGHLVPVVFRLPYKIAVPDILFELELRERHPRPSMMDHSALALAFQEQCPLLTGDKELRIAAKKRALKCMGRYGLLRDCWIRNLYSNPKPKPVLML